MALSMSRMDISLCPLNGVVEDRRFLRVVSRGPYQVVQVQRIVLGFYRPQKDLSWAEKQAFKEEQKILALLPQIFTERATRHFARAHAPKKISIIFFMT